MQLSHPYTVYFLEDVWFSANAFELYKGLPRMVWIARDVRGVITY